ncbi:dihydrofolate reductase [Altererythrobacter sp.]|nr:dihydrofolate reductase [Altererythrobacter sp.]
MIYARAANGTIGKDGTMPWHLPADLKRFKALTMGHALIMGRKTFESFPSPLPGRRHIVLTRNTDWHAEGAEVAHSRADALQMAGAEPIAIIGGAEINRMFEKDAERIEMTQIHADYAGDTVMDAPSSRWAGTAREDHPADGGRPAFSFLTFLREPS